MFQKRAKHASGAVSDSVFYKARAGTGERGRWPLERSVEPEATRISVVASGGSAAGGADDGDPRLGGEVEGPAVVVRAELVGTVGAGAGAAAVVADVEEVDVEGAVEDIVLRAARGRVRGEDDPRAKRGERVTSVIARGRSVHARV